MTRPPTWTWTQCKSKPVAGVVGVVGSPICSQFFVFLPAVSGRDIQAGAVHRDLQSCCGILCADFPLLTTDAESMCVFAPTCGIHVNRSQELFQLKTITAQSICGHSPVWLSARLL